MSYVITKAGEKSKKGAVDDGVTYKNYTLEGAFSEISLPEYP